MIKQVGALALAILGSATIASAQGVAPAASQGPPVIVTAGEGIVKVAPDRAWVTIAAETREPNPAEAQRLNTQAMTAVIAQIKAAGVAADAIRTSGYALQPEFEYVGGRRTLRDYLADDEVEVRVDTLSSLGGILAAAVGTGATNVSGVRFDLKDRHAAERQALTEAVRDARARADAVAAGAGVQIERVLRIQEGGPLPGPPPIPMAAARQMVAAAPAPPVPIESGEIEVRAEVTLTAAIR